MRKIFFHARHAVSTIGLLTASAAHAQMLNYGEALSAYKDMRDSGIPVTDTVTPGVAAKASIARAIDQNRVVMQNALLQPDGTIKLPANQTNLVVQSSYGNVQQGMDGGVRIASPSISGDVTGNVTLFVDGKGIENVTVINNGKP